MTTEADQREKLKTIVKGARTAFMVTGSGAAGEMHGRPMANAGVDDSFEAIWFASDRQSGKIAELLADPSVCLGYTNTTGSEWASISGDAEVVDDRAKIKELWSPMWKVWFTGPDDPKLILVRVRPRSAEYWDSGSIFLAVAKIAFSAITGKHVDPGKNAQVDLAAGKR